MHSNKCYIKLPSYIEELFRVSRTEQNFKVTYCKHQINSTHKALKEDVIENHRRRLVFSPGGGAQKISCSSQRIVRAEGVKVMFLFIFLYCLFLFEHGRREKQEKVK